jgi:hypothetical protein
MVCWYFQSVGTIFYSQAKIKLLWQCSHPSSISFIYILYLIILSEKLLSYEAPKCSSLTCYKSNRRRYSIVSTVDDRRHLCSVHRNRPWDERESQVLRHVSYRGPPQAKPTARWWFYPRLQSVQNGHLGVDHRSQKGNRQDKGKERGL